MWVTPADDGSSLRGGFHLGGTSFTRGLLVEFAATAHFTGRAYASIQDPDRSRNLRRSIVDAPWRVGSLSGRGAGSSPLRRERQTVDPFEQYRPVQLIA